MAHQDEVTSVLSGFGLLLFAIRYLTFTLDNGLSRKIRPILLKMTRSSLLCVISGWVITLLVQTSSVTLLTSMSLLARGLITLEQGILIVLGAGLGSSMKGLYSPQIWALIGPMVIAVCSISYFLAKTIWKRKLSEFGLAIGFIFISLKMIEKGVTPLATGGFLGDFLSGLSCTNYLCVFRNVGLGILFATGVQSSSSVLMISLEWAKAGIISVASAASLVLGANIGTTSTGLIASIGQSTEVRRLAVAYCLMKGIGAIFVALFFNAHLLFIEDILGLLKINSSPEITVAAFHIFFNLMTALTWMILLSFLVKIVQRIVPERVGTLRIPFLNQVQNLLFKMPERLLEEVRSELKEVVRNLYLLLESIFECLLEAESGKKKKSLIDSVNRDLKSSVANLESIKSLLLKTSASRRCFEKFNRELESLLYMTQVLLSLTGRVSEFVLRLEFDWDGEQEERHRFGDLEYLVELKKKISGTFSEIYSLNIEEIHPIYSQGENDLKKGTFEKLSTEELDFATDAAIQFQTYLDTLRLLTRRSHKNGLPNETGPIEDMLVDSGDPMPPFNAGTARPSGLVGNS